MTSDVHHLSDETLNEWLDQALEAHSRPAVEAHLAACRDCAARLDILRSLFARLEALPDLPLERDLSASVVTAIRRPAAAARQPARASWLAGLIFAGQAAAAVVLLAFAWPVAAGLAAQLPTPLAASGLSSIMREWSDLLFELPMLVAHPPSSWNMLQNWLAAFPAGIASILPAWLHPLEAALIVAAAAGIWLIGNALVLTPPLLARLRRNS